MGPGQYFNIHFSINKEIRRPWLQRYTTVGNYKVFQCGFLGVFFQLNYGFPK